jgi:hypothetical protein
MAEEVVEGAEAVERLDEGSLISDDSSVYMLGDAWLLSM